MSEAWTIVWFGVVVILLGLFSVSISPGVPTLQSKPEYPVPKRLRNALVVGLSRLLPKL